MMKWETPKVTGTIEVKFPDFDRRYCPHVVKIGDLTVEFQDETCDRVNDIWLEVAGRKLHVHVTPCGIAPIEVIVHLKGDGNPHYGELYSRRPDGVFHSEREDKSGH